MRSVTLHIMVVAAIVGLVTCYIGGYYLLGKRCDRYSLAIQNLPDGTRRPIKVTERIYKRKWVSAIFQPAGWIESTLLGEDVEIHCEDIDARGDSS